MSAEGFGSVDVWLDALIRDCRETRQLLAEVKGVTWGAEKRIAELEGSLERIRGKVQEARSQMNGDGAGGMSPEQDPTQLTLW